MSYFEHSVVDLLNYSSIVVEEILNYLISIVVEMKFEIDHPKFDFDFDSKLEVADESSMPFVLIVVSPFRRNTSLCLLSISYDSDFENVTPTPRRQSLINPSVRLDMDRDRRFPL